MKTVLFDLDGTLLQMEFNPFLRDYFSAISNHCRKLAEPQVFVKKLLASTNLMLHNEGLETNQEVFMKDFTNAIQVREEELSPLLEDFYTNEFPKLHTHAIFNNLSSLVLRETLARGWQIVIATNPLFPKLAIEERMRWAGIQDFPWTYVSSYENSSACKPNLFYYREIMDKLGLNPEECWMVGNDAQEDMIAGQLGFNTYLVTDYLIAREGAPQPKACGSLQEFLTYMREKIS